MQQKPFEPINWRGHQISTIVENGQRVSKKLLPMAFAQNKRYAF
jgi:hypothetical protein